MTIKLLKPYIVPKSAIIRLAKSNLAQKSIWVYDRPMRENQSDNQHLKGQLIAASGIIIIAALLAFAGWLGTGDQLMMSLIQSGLAWCL